MCEKLDKELEAIKEAMRRLDAMPVPSAGRLALDPVTGEIVRT